MHLYRLLTFGFLVLSLALAEAASDETRPSRCVRPEVRREWRTFSRKEKKAWIDAVMCLAKQPHSPALNPTIIPTPPDIGPIQSNSSYYDDWSYVHQDLNIRIHGTGLFLPWHRWYVEAYNRALRTRCGYRGVGPYWDWTKDAARFYEASIWDDDPSSGLGRWGDPTKDYAVQTGGFSKLKLAYPSTHILRRNFTLQPFLTFPFPLPNPAIEANSTFTKEKVDAIVSGYEGDFVHFQAAFEAADGPHSGVHLIMGGDLGGTCPQNAPPGCTPGPTWSPNDPLFWLHHGMVDKIWFDWQRRSPKNARAFKGGSVQPFPDLIEFPNGKPPWLTLDSLNLGDGIFPDVTIGDVLSTTGGELCYVYE